MKIFDTISAIATPIGSGGIAIIRVSGENSEEIVQKIARAKNGKSLSEIQSHMLTLCDIHRPHDKDFIIDEALVSVMRAPKSFTGETVVEINCHGGYLAAKTILNMLLSLGSRMAEAGEFTRRAFMNGKTDMLGAEATMDLIDAKSDLGLSNAARALGGKLSDKINDIRSDIMDITAHISGAADYPDEVDEIETTALCDSLNRIIQKVDKLINGFSTGKILRDGITTVIIGKPNVGKSSLLNALSRTDRAIVTDIPGTTRDTIEEYINICGASLKLLDTAGIRENASDEVERIGIDRSIENMENSDLCLFVLDSSDEFDKHDEEIAKKLTDKNVIVILNKTDKNQKITLDDISLKLNISKDDIIETSTPKDGEITGIDRLESRIAEKFAIGQLNPGDVFISNARQLDSCVKAKQSLALALGGAENSLPFDLLYIDLEDALSSLGEVIGLTVQEEIIDTVFERFCVGK